MLNIFNRIVKKPQMFLWEWKTLNNFPDAISVLRATRKGSNLPCHLNFPLNVETFSQLSKLKVIIIIPTTLNSSHLLRKPRQRYGKRFLMFFFCCQSAHSTAICGAGILISNISHNKKKNSSQTFCGLGKCHTWHRRGCDESRGYEMHIYQHNKLSFARRNAPPEIAQ